MSVSNANPTSGVPGMETIVAIALGALAAVFLGALFVLLIICRRQRCYYVRILLIVYNTIPTVLKYYYVYYKNTTTLLGFIFCRSKKIRQT